MHIYLVINFIVALWVYYDSQKQGYSFGKGLLWAIGVFLVLFIFLPLYLFSRAKRRRLAFSRAARPSYSATCFYCGKPYEGDPKFCPNCGQNLKPQS